MQLFLDANAHVSLNSKSAQFIANFQNELAAHGHPSSPSAPGRAAAFLLEQSRTKIAKLIGAERPDQVFFTSTCTQASEWAMDIFFRINNNKIREKFENNHCIGISQLEHTAVTQAFDLIVEKYNYVNTKKLKNDLNGIVTDDADKVICIGLQNEIGTIQPLNNFKDKLLFSDLSQSLGKIPVNVTELNIDVAILGSHKFGGTNLGFVYLKDTNYWRSFGTGSRYYLDRPGTPDVMGIAATAIALEEAVESLPSRTKNMISFQKTLEEGLESLGGRVIGKSATRSPNTTFVNFTGKAMNIVLGLGEKNIHVGLGSACGSYHTGSSKTMTALGENGSTHDYLRISQWGDYNEEHAKTVLEAMKELV